MLAVTHSAHAKFASVDAELYDEMIVVTSTVHWHSDRTAAHRLQGMFSACDIAKAP